MLANQLEVGMLPTLCANVVELFSKNFHIHILGRREGFIDPKQMTEDFRTEDFSFSFRSMDRTSLKIFLFASWYLEDEYTSYYLRDSLERLLRQKSMTIDKGETEFLSYLISKSSATKAFQEEFEGKERKIFGLLLQKDREGKHSFPVVFVKVKPLKKKKVPKYTGYCRGYKSSTPAKKDAGENLRKDIQQNWNKELIVYRILFDLLPKIDEALLLAGFTDNYQQVNILLKQKAKLEFELETL